MKTRLLFFLFIFSVVIDVINGYLQLQLGYMTPIGVIYRGGVFAYMIPSLLKNKIISVRLFLLVLLISFAFIVWVLIYNAHISTEVEFLIRYSYFFIVLNYFYVNKDSFPASKILNYVRFYGLLIALVIIFGYITGLGFNSYSEEGDYGWGSTGFFIATNDVGLTILCCLISACIYHSEVKSNIVSLAIIFVIAVGGILIGSRVCFLFIPFTLLLYAFYKAINSKKIYLILILVPLVLFAIVYIGIWVYNLLDDYALSRLTIESVENARTVLTDEAKKYIHNFDITSSLLGRGVGNLHEFVGRRIGYDGERSVEADYYEIVGSYGYFLGGIVLVSYILIVIKAIRCYFKNKSFESFGFMYMTISYIVIAFFAGHAVTNLMAAPVFAVSTILLWNKSTTASNNIH